MAAYLKYAKAAAASNTPLGVNVTVLDMLHLGSMYMHPNECDYTDPHLMVAAGSVVHKVVEMLNSDPAFLVTVGEKNRIDWHTAPIITSDDTGIAYYSKLPADTVWCAIALIKDAWYRQRAGGESLNIVAMTSMELRVLLGRLAFDESSIDTLINVHKENPRAVATTLECIISQSVHRLISRAVGETSSKENEDATETKAEADDTPAPEATATTSAAAPVDRDAYDPIPEPEPLVVSNDEISVLVCTEVRKRVTNQYAATALEEHVRDTIAELTRTGTQIANMDQRVQMVMMNSNIALAIVFAYTLMGPDNPYANRILNAFMMIDPVTGEEDHGPAPDNSISEPAWTEKQ